MRHSQGCCLISRSPLKRLIRSSITGSVFIRLYIPGISSSSLKYRTMLSLSRQVSTTRSLPSCLARTIWSRTTPVHHLSLCCHLNTCPQSSVLSRSKSLVGIRMIWELFHYGIIIFSISVHGIIQSVLL